MLDTCILNMLSSQNKDILLSLLLHVGNLSILIPCLSCSSIGMRYISSRKLTPVSIQVRCKRFYVLKLLHRTCTRSAGSSSDEMNHCMTKPTK